MLSPTSAVSVSRKAATPLVRVRIAGLGRISTQLPCASRPSEYPADTALSDRLSITAPRFGREHEVVVPRTA